MRNLGIILTASLFAVSCYNSKPSKQSDESNVESIELSSSIVQVDSIEGFSLSGTAQAIEASISCPS